MMDNEHAPDSAPEPAEQSESTPAPSEPATPSTGPAVASESRGWAVAAHLVPFIGLSFIGPLIVWLMKKDEDPFVAEHARQALNFQILVLIAAIISGFLIILIIGLILLPIVLIVAAIFMIIAAVKAANGEEYRYPINVNFVK